MALPLNAQQDTNLANSATAEASSVHPHGHVASRAIDGRIGDSHRWVSAVGDGPHTLTLTLSAQFEIAGAHLYTGYGAADPVQDFVLQYWDGRRWLPIPGTQVRGNDQAAVVLTFEETVATTRVRLVSPDETMRVKELLLWPPDAEGVPALGAGLEDGSIVPPDPNQHYVLANQCGFDTLGPKRFTAPHSPDGSTFTVRRVEDDAELFRGRVRDGVGDFSDFAPREGDDEYLIRVEGQDKRTGSSFPFVVRPQHMERLSLDPALRFMVDARSMVGSHPSAYGGTPWRDGTFYTYEMPSLVLQYLANPGYYDRAPVEIDWEADKARVMAPGFNWVRARIDGDMLDATRRYYTELDAPVGEDVPDLIQIIHWTVGMYLMDPANQDPSGGDDGDKIHAQTVEQFAYFIYAYPFIAEYFTDAFYQRASEFTRAQWEAVGLLEVITQVGGPKGRHAPGHSVMPNLMMYDVAQREGWPDADRYLSAAVAQARWVIDTFEPDDVRVGKGQRMSEHKTITGLTMLQRVYPDHAPEGLAQWLGEWQRGVVAASENLYDFRRYSETEWTLPKPWNEPGNIAGLPGLIDAVSMAVGPTRLDDRLGEIRTAHIDNLFGRNPVNAASPNRAADYPGIDRGWPIAYLMGVTARMELVRGALSSNAATEHYPLSPHVGFRHPEGWTTFNAAWNVTLAYRCRALTEIAFQTDEGGPARNLTGDGTYSLVVHALADVDPEAKESLALSVHNGETVRQVEVTQVDADGLVFRAECSPASLGLTPGQDAVISYGYGLMATKTKLTWNARTESWQVSELR